MTHQVAIFGGGVGGMTAAHELARVGGDKVEITVYERNRDAGGKARSFRKQGSAAPGNEPLPGEHGFRFFPGYYQHLVKTMQRIPYPGGGARAKVADNLVEAPETHFARTTGVALELANKFPSSVEEMARIFTFGPQVDIPMADAMRFARRLRDLLCACDDRRFYEFESMSWFDFTEADKCSSDYKKYLADGLNQRTVAASGKDVSARTVGLTLIRIMNDWLHPGNCIDRVLNGPTSERWLEPWREHLLDLGVRFVFDNRLTEMGWSATAGVTGATVCNGAGRTRQITADSYVVALPMADAKVVFDGSGMVNHDTGLQGFGADHAPLTDDWMNGIQFYLDGPLDMAAGHTIFVDSPFSLTSIEQRQFWDGIDFAKLGDGSVQAILSVDISDWDTPCPCHKRTAKQMTREEIKDEVLAQVAAHHAASYPNQPMPNVVDWFLDPAIVERPAARHTDDQRLDNLEGLFINTTSSWGNRPAAVLRVDSGLANLYLASDYVRTSADLATMEGANEAGRMAARGVLEQMGEPAAVQRRVELYDFPEPAFFRAFRVADDILFNTPQGPQIPGLPHTDQPPPQAPENLPDEWVVTP